MSEKNKKHREDIVGDSDFRKVMLVCASCRFHDIDTGTLLEIDFKSGLMSYVCRDCKKENRIKLNPANSNYPGIQSGIGR